MVSKILLIALICCTPVFASPIDRTNASIEEAESSEKIPGISRILEKHVWENVGQVKSLKEVFNKIEQRLESKEFREAIEESLQKIAKIIFNEENELIGDAKTKEIIQKQLEKIGNAFQEIYEEAIEKIKKNNKKSVDATEFKNTVDELKQLVDKLYHK